MIKNDFTFDVYKKTILTAKDCGYSFIGFNAEKIKRQTKQKICLLRHDIDNELWSCLPMAELENQIGVQATYFVMPRSTTYNLLCVESREVIKELLKMGHHIGLHFMAEYHATSNTKMLKQKIKIESQIIAREFKAPVAAFSFHQPTKEIIAMKLNITGMINTYDKSQLQGVTYISDSNMIWQIEHPLRIFQESLYLKLQLLIHPMWWTPNVTSLKNKWQRVLHHNQQTVVSHLKQRERSLKNISL